MGRTVARRVCIGLLMVLVLVAPAWPAEIHVSDSTPKASDSNEGSAAAPLRTIARGLQLLKPGDTLIIGAGTYREPLMLPQHLLNQPTDRPRTIIRGATDGRTVIKGSVVVSEWTQAANGIYKTGWSTDPQQVFMDGKPLQQIGGRVFVPYPELEAEGGVGDIWPGRVDGDQNTMPLGSFYYDLAAETLYVRPESGSLQGRTVEVSALRYLLFAHNANNLTLENLTFEHSNTTLDSRAGAVTLLGNGIVIDRVSVRDVDGTGIDLSGNDITVRNSVMTRAGQVGLKMRGERALLDGNETSYNNTRGFNKWFEAGGAKFMGDGGLRNSTVRNHRAFFNNGDGIWFDWNNRYNLVIDTIAIGNKGFGIHYEASSYGTIANNISAANEQRGIYLPHSHDMVVAHNFLAHNGLEGLVIIDEGRSSGGENFSLRPADNTIAANIFLDNAEGAIRLPDNIVRTTSTENVVVDGGATFSRGWGGADMTLDAWRGLTGMEEGTISLGGTWKRPSEDMEPSALAAEYVRLAAAIRAQLKPLQRLTTLPPEAMHKGNDKAGPLFPTAAPQPPQHLKVK